MNARNANKLISPLAPSPKARLSLNLHFSGRHLGTEHERSRSMTSGINTSHQLLSHGHVASTHNHDDSPNNFSIMNDNNNDNQLNDSESSKLSMDIDVANKIRRSSLSDAVDVLSRNIIHTDDSEADKPVRRSTSDFSSPHFGNMKKKNYHSDSESSDAQKSSSVFSFILPNESEDVKVSSNMLAAGGESHAMHTPNSKGGKTEASLRREISLQVRARCPTRIRVVWAPTLRVKTHLAVQPALKLAM